MANYQRTQELFNGEPNREPGLKYEKSGEQLAEEKWFAQVKNPNTGEFFQLEDLRSLGAVPADFRKDEKPKKYPFKKVDTIIRIKKADGSEWLKSRQSWIGHENKFRQEQERREVERKKKDRELAYIMSTNETPSAEGWKRLFSEE
jgi:hypothetical protein